MKNFLTLSIKTLVVLMLGLFKNHFGKILLSTLGVLYIPATLFVSNIIEFNYQFNLLFIPLGVSLSLFLITIILSRFLPKNTEFVYAGAAVAIFLCDSFFRAEYGLLDGTGYKVEQNNIISFMRIMVFIGIPSFFYLYRKKIELHLQLAAFFCSLFFVLSYITLYFYSAYNGTDQYIIKNENNKNMPNVYMIWLDALDGNHLNSRLSSDEILEKNMENFVSFKNTTTSYIYSNHSFTSFMSGTFPTKFVKPTDETVPFADSLSKVRDFYGVLKQNGYTITAYTLPEFTVGTEDLVVNSGDVYESQTSVGQSKNDFLMSWFIRSLPVASLYFTESLIEITKSVVSIFSKNNNLYVPTNVSEGVHPYTGVLMLKKAKEDERNRLSNNQFVLLHAVLPHGPFVIDENCDYIGKRSTYQKQEECATMLVMDFLNDLKKSDKYKDSVIIIFGDHGSGWEKILATEGDMSILNENIGNYTSQQLLSRVNPALLIKPINNSETENLKFSNIDAQLVDIVPTIISQLKINYDPDYTLDGADLFSRLTSSESQIRYLYYYKHRVNIDLNNFYSIPILYNGNVFSFGEQIRHSTQSSPVP